ncbi:MAG TPA: 3-hydroxyacyl-ACP dehydratase FabZ [Devosia sp.]|nr:3-hydroxyacyl-ACP dehydratase FabZ [Devosia sp.]
MDQSLVSETQTRQLKSLDIKDLLTCLPHRYPFLMLDKIIDIDGDERATGIKNISFNEPIFQGHFPGDPVFPGVLIIEGMAQTAGAIVIAAEREKGSAHLVYMLTIDKAKFRKPAVPGDRLEYHIEKIKRRKNVGRFYARAMVGDTLIAEAEVGAMIVEQ